MRYLLVWILASSVSDVTVFFSLVHLYGIALFILHYDTNKI